MMKAAVIYAPGGPEKFVIEQRQIPGAAAGQVLVKVKAFGLNRSELMTRKGLSPSVRFPRVLGIECVGEIEHDPSGEYARGQQVAALMGEMGRDYDGSYAEYTVLPKRIVFPFTSGLPWEQLGAFPEMFQTVFGSLHLALNIVKGETLLIRGGTSSIGMLATQIAKNFGLTVIATTRNMEKEKILKENILLKSIKPAVTNKKDGREYLTVLQEKYIDRPSIYEILSILKSLYSTLWLKC